MNIAQLIHRDRTNRQQNKAVGSIKNNAVMAVTNILDTSNDKEQENIYIPNQSPLRSKYQGGSRYRQHLAMGNRRYGESLDAQIKSNYNNDISTNSNNSSSYSNFRSSNSTVVIDLGSPSQSLKSKTKSKSKFLDFKPTILPQTIISERAFVDLLTPKKWNNSESELKEKKRLLEEQSGLKSEGLYGLNGNTNENHNNYLKNNIILNKGLVAGNKFTPIGPGHTKGWRKLIHFEKEKIIRGRKEYDSEKEEKEENLKIKQIKAENNKQRRELLRNEKEEEEQQNDAKELHHDMDRRYIKYIKEKKRKQRHFQEEKTGKEYDTRMCANGWMKTNLDAKPVPEKPVDITSMIDLDFDPTEKSGDK